MHAAQQTRIEEAPSQEPTAELSTQGRSAGNIDGTIPETGSLEVPISYEYMVLDSMPYLCSIPEVVITPKNETSAAQSKAEEEKELARATDRGLELLKDMEDHCMYFISGWWSYSFCYNKHVKQFHQLPSGRGGIPSYPPVEDNTTPSYILGKFESRRPSGNQIDGQQSTQSSSPGPLDVTQMQTKGDMRYLVQKLSGGTTCDLTGKPRKVEVQFHCHPQGGDRISWIKEVTTCSYLMVIYTPRLCNDVAFLPQKETMAHPITCQEIVSEDQIDDWKARKTVEAERKLVNGGSTKSEKPGQMVGDIEVGGMNIIGKGQRLETPKFVQQQQQQESSSNAVGKAEIVAKGDPKEKGGKVQKLSNEDLKKMGLDPATVDVLRQELEQLAGSKAWTLEVVDTQDGYKELRATVEGDDEEEDRNDAKEKSGDGDGDGEEGSEEIYKDEL